MPSQSDKAVVPLSPDEQIDDETALARMLASEDHRRAVKIVIGWITVQRARRRRVSLYQMITGGKGYGPEERSGVYFYASSKWPPSDNDRQIARDLLAGKLKPSELITRHQPGSWVERRVKRTVSDDRIIALQEEFEEGIYGQIETTGWVLYSRDTPPIQIEPYENAKARLDDLPKLPSVDRVIS